MSRSRGDMAKLSGKLTPKKEKDIRILTDFVGIYCREHHVSADKQQFTPVEMGLPASSSRADLCPECDRLLKHGIAKLLLCRHDPKPMCKKCRTHCYAPAYRERIKEVMKFSGLYLIKHGRLDLLLHYKL